MRILQIGLIPREIGGITQGGIHSHIWELAKHLSDNNHQVAILADNFFSTQKMPATREGVKLYGYCNNLLLKHLKRVLSPSYVAKSITIKIYLGERFGFKYMLNNWLFYVEYAINDFSPEVIHVHTLEKRFPYVYFVSKSKIPIVVTIHSFTSIKFSKSLTAIKYKKLARKNIKLVKNLIFVSDFVRNEFKNFFGDFRGKIWVVPNPLNALKFYPTDKVKACDNINEPKDKKLLLFVGNLIKRKGVFLLLEATKLLKERNLNVKTIIVGSGPEEKKIKKIVEQNQLQKYVSIKGYRYQSELLDYYNAADLFVMPSSGESFGLVYVESLLCGLPVIGNEGVADIVIPSDEYGLLVPPNNVDALANAIEKGLKKKWNEEKIINYARSFDWRKKIMEFEDIYSDLKR